MKTASAGSALYRAFLKACGSWRDPNPCAPHLGEVGRNWCVACYFPKHGRFTNLKAEHNMASTACLLNRKNAA